MVAPAGTSDAIETNRAVRYGPVCDIPVPRPAMLQWWDELTFIHWRFDPVVVQRLLPEGLAVETFDGTAWVGLVPFSLRVGFPGVPPLPWAARFPETNVRTYVQARDGARGVWFFSLDAARLGAVLVARSTYHLPYFWSRMSIDRAGSRISYQCRRRWPGRKGTASRAIIEIDRPFESHELGELDHFLTARWMLVAMSRLGLRRASAFHEPWPLHRAHLASLDDELVTAAGLPVPRGAPLVHYSPSVAVRIGPPTLI